MAMSEADAIRRQQQTAEVARVKASLGQQQAKRELDRIFSQAKGDLKGREAGARNTLFSFLTGEADILQRTVSDIRTQGRRQAASSGLIGGGQEAGIINPAIERSLTNFAQVGSQAQLDFEGLFGGLESNLNLAEIGVGQDRFAGFQRSQDSAIKALLGSQENFGGDAGEGIAKALAAILPLLAKKGK